ncbi:MAG TPA: M14 family metallopeptidase [Gaiellaceae bacterium]|nr:M14 family metallopeptidase [Gaiellaceae bacterium]
MRPVAYDHFYGYDELTETLRAWAQEAPQLCALESIGKSYEGRDIWLVTLTNTDTGAHADKPGFLIEANIHSMEWTGCTAALHLIHRLLTQHGQDERATRVLDTRTFYIVPRLNPDGAERGLEERRFIRSSVRPYPRDEPEDGLQVQDIDGDGRVLDMRVEDPNGAWREHPEEKGLLVRRDPVDGPDDGPFYRLLNEGRLLNYDGIQIKVPWPLEGLDLNRNFPAEWAPEHQQRGAGPYPTSEPEVRAIVQAITERPNITGFIAYHTFSGVHLRPYSGRPDDDFPTNDLRAYQIIGARGTELTGYPAVSIFHDFKYHPKETIKGGADDWIYDHLGLFAWTTEFWSPQRQAGLADYHFTDWIREHPIEDDVKLIRWARENYPDAYVDWYEFDHPELGKVELGGWDIINFWFNVPFDRLEQEVAPHSEWAIFHALISPLLEVRSLDVERLGETSFLVRLVVQNAGWLPTNVTEKALERKAVRDTEVELELPEGAKLVGGELKTEVGQLKGRVEKRSTTWWANDESTSDLAKLEWVIEASAGTEIGIEARHQRAGTIRRRVTLE